METKVISVAYKSKSHGDQNGQTTSIYPGANHPIIRHHLLQNKWVTNMPSNIVFLHNHKHLILPDVTSTSV